MAEFDLSMPPTSMRKLPAQDAKRMFSMAPAPIAAESSESDVDELTAMNASVLAEMDQYDSESDEEDNANVKAHAIAPWSSSRRNNRRSSAASSSSLRPVAHTSDSIVPESDDEDSENDQEISFNQHHLPSNVSNVSNGNPAVANWTETGSSSDTEGSSGSSSSGSGGSSSSDDDESDVDMSMTMQNKDLSSAMQRRESLSGNKRSSSSPVRPTATDSTTMDNSGHKRMRVERPVRDGKDQTIELESLGDLLTTENNATVATLHNAQDEQETVQLEGGIDSLLQDFDGDASNGSGASGASGGSSGSSSDESDDEDDSMMDMEDNQPTGTVELEGGMMAMIANVSRDVKILGADQEEHTVELEQGLGSLLAGMSPASSRRDSTNDSSFTNHHHQTSSPQNNQQSLGIVSPSTPAPSTKPNDAAAASAAHPSPVGQSPRRKTPVPQPVSLATISQALQMGNALELEVLDYAELGKLVSEYGDMTPDASHNGADILLQRRESIVKVALLLKDRCVDLHTRLQSNSFKLGLQKLGRAFSNHDSQTTEDMSRAAAIFMAVARAEARVDWAGQATEIENVSIETLAHSAAVVSGGAWWSTWWNTFFIVFSSSTSCSSFFNIFSNNFPELYWTSCTLSSWNLMQIQSKHTTERSPI